ncbi:uncharacterized protein LOC110177526 [Drosophila serrata]|uniref:uncharacterized protein LOC110177526 n=1 Tax=Drosophila serrata TaxID=7274 RepID=UPI000A1D3159|nr:uncharacterized protein LOC110177526 [Drosophila serrata]
MNRRSKRTLSYYSSDESTEDLEFSQKCVVTACECNEFEAKADNFIADLENQLRKSEMDLMLANVKIAVYDDKIKDKNDIIDALKTTNNLLKSENREMFDAQAVAIKKLQDELNQKCNEKVINQKSVEERADELSKSALLERLQRNNDSLEEKVKSYQEKEEDNKKLIATLQAQIRQKDDQIILLEMGQNLDTIKIKEKDDLIKDQEAIMKRLEVAINSKKK